DMRASFWYTPGISGPAFLISRLGAEQRPHARLDGRMSGKEARNPVRRFRAERLADEQVRRGVGRAAHGFAVRAYLFKRRREAVRVPCEQGAGRVRQVFAPARNGELDELG